MTDLNEEHGKDPKPEKPNPLLDILIGFFLSVVAYILIITVGMSGMPRVLNALIVFGILGAFVFLIVKYFRTGRETAALIMLILISPAILIFLMTGACFLF